MWARWELSHERGRRLIGARNGSCVPCSLLASTGTRIFTHPTSLKASADAVVPPLLLGPPSNILLYTPCDAETLASTLNGFASGLWGPLRPIAPGYASIRSDTRCCWVCSITLVPRYIGIPQRLRRWKNVPLSEAALVPRLFREEGRCARPFLSGCVPCCWKAEISHSRVRPPPTVPQDHLDLWARDGNCSTTYSLDRSPCRRISRSPALSRW